MDEQLYTTAEIITKLGYDGAERSKQRAIESRLSNLRNGEHQRRMRKDGSEYQTELPPRLLEGTHWERRYGRILYTAMGLREVRKLIARPD